MKKLRGTYTVIITPFNRDEGQSIDETMLRWLVDFQISEGIHGLIALASNGEFLSLDDEERREVARIVVDQAAGRVPVSNMRQTIARRLVESSTEIPHYQVSMTFDMDPLLDLRKTLNEQLAGTGVKLSVNDFLVRACALSMYQHPDFNASWGGDAIIVHREVNVGIAISVGPERGAGWPSIPTRAGSNFGRKGAAPS